VLLAIDPGLRNVGAALFGVAEGGLKKAGLVRSTLDGLDGPYAWRETAAAVRSWVGWDTVLVTRVTFEQPGAYRSDSAGRTLNLQDLVAIDAWICSFFPHATYSRYFPMEWQGNLKRPKTHKQKDPVVERIRRELSPEELQRVILPAPSLAHNVWDAVGIGLKALGRFEPYKYTGKGV
jgi:hypothetical protein